MRREVIESVRLLDEDSSTSSGYVWNVEVIREGMNKSSTREYTRQSVESVARKLDQLQCYVDHPTKTEANEREERGLRELLGWYTDPQHDGDRVTAKLHLLTTGPAAEITEMIKEAADRGNPNLVGLSIRGVGENELVRENGHMFERVHEITELVSADAVTRPGAGGRMVSVAESENNELRRDLMEFSDMSLEDILKARPDLKAYLKSEPEESEEDDEEARRKKDKKDEDYDYDEGYSKPKGKKKESEDSAELTAVTESAKTVVEEARRERTAAAVERELAREELPQPLEERVRERFEGQVATSDEIREAVASERSLWDQLMDHKQAGQREFNPQVSVTKDEREKFLHRLDATIAGHDVEGCPPFTGLREAYYTWKNEGFNPYRAETHEAQDIVVNSRGFTAVTRPKTNEQILQEANTYPSRVQEATLTTSSWSTVLGNTLYRHLVKAYEDPELDAWRRVVSRVVTLPDLKTQNFSLVGGFTMTPSVSEGGTYQQRSVPSESNPTLSPTKYGDLMPLTIEAIINDDVGALQRIPVELGKSIKTRIYQTVFDLMDSNSSIYDSTALAASGHSNSDTNTLSADNVETGIRKVRDQTPLNATDRPLALRPKFLLVPNDLEDLSWRLVNSNVLVGAGNNQATEPNLIKAKYGMEVVVVDYWSDTSTTAWWLMADPAKVDTIAAGFYPSQTPEFFQQEDPTTGSNFTADKVTYKTRQWFGVTVLDYRPFYRGNS